VGGGVAGSEAAARLAERGIYSVVVEMDSLPYGKIELGLPKWHAKQRDQEEQRIDQNLDSPYVQYLPCTKLGKDLGFSELQRIGFTVILLAVGAWQDRPLSVPGIDEYEGHGFEYQNPFVAWFNAYHSPQYDGRQMDLVDDAAVVGGGLASIDVVKILQLETTRKALEQKGYLADLFTLEKKGIPQVLAGFDLEWSELGLKGCTLYYRRRAQDMPLIPVADHPSAAKLEKVKAVRQKVLNTALSKYLFRFEPCCIPVGKLVEIGRLAGLVFQETEVIEGRAKAIPGTEFEVRSPLVISSIGSVPEAIPGLPVEGNLFRIPDPATGKVAGLENVFALGNAVTGRGNIRDSRIHSRSVAGYVMDEFLGWKREDFETLSVAGSCAVPDAEGEIDEFIKSKRLRSPAQIQSVLDQVKKLQKRVGYNGNYYQWVDSHRPVRYEHLSKK
jgi:NADPH-dependent glutamate synthase beta subunit-like oxidoreductase